MSGELKRKIMIIEDDRVSAMSLSVFLEREGFEPEVHYGTNDILSLVDQNQPEGILMDVTLKGSSLSGLEAAELIRKKTQIPILFITGGLDSEMMDQISFIERTAVIQKPYFPEMIISELKQLMVK